MKSLLDQRGRILIQISDNGQGILPEVLDRIFVPFFTTKPKGSGIGLSLSRQILRLHGGTLTVHSEPDVETIFTLRF
ncbi:ATP-binding protein [Prolixibacter bellariivorans]|nr:ATP-binding protein [Prolixibacter bellariivorans]